MSDTKNKIIQVLNDNYMVNLFSAQAREHIANKIVESLNDNYDANKAPENTVAIKPPKIKKETKDVNSKTKKSSVDNLKKSVNKNFVKPKLNVKKPDTKNKSRV